MDALYSRESLAVVIHVAELLEIENSKLECLFSHIKRCRDVAAIHTHVPKVVNISTEWVCHWARVEALLGMIHGSCGFAKLDSNYTEQ